MPFDSAREEDLGVAAGAGPFAKLFTPTPAADAMLRVLIEARAWLDDPAHWCRFNYGLAGGPTCVNGALMRASSALSLNWCDIRDWLKPLLPRGHSFTHAFNDDRRTTHADVLALCDCAIAARRAELAS